MSMKKFTLLMAAALVMTAGAATAAEWPQAWKATGFDLPESVSWDKTAKVFYVSNLGGDPMTKDGNGFISRLKSDGSVDALRWVTGLDAPKGTEVVGDRLWVADIDRLVEIDTTNGAIVNTYAAPGAKFLNDLAVAGDGRIFIADTFGNAIYVYKDGAITEFLRDNGLVGPNGLVVDNKELIVAELGDASQGFDKLKPGRVKAVNLETKAVTDYSGTDALGGLDGIEFATGDGVFVTDNPGGRLLRVRPGKEVKEVMKLKPGAADFEMVPDAKLLVVPQMQQNEVVAYTANKL
jgi:sugar lactone lactonase YvrE